MLGEWYKKNLPKIYRMTYIEKIKYAFEAARSGILAKAKQLGGKALKQGEDLARTLMKDVRENDPERLLKVTANLFSRESFLYREANSFLRNNILEDTDVMGPFCFLLNEYLGLTEVKALENCLRSGNMPAKGIVYRGLYLPEGAIEASYPKGEKMLRLTSFSSCFFEKRFVFPYILIKNPRYPSKLLFEIEIPEESGLFCRDITKDSIYPIEEEVLLPPGSVLVVKERFDDFIEGEKIDTIKGVLLPNKQASYNLKILKEYVDKFQHQTRELKIFNDYLASSKKKQWWGSLVRLLKEAGEVIWHWKANKDPWSTQEQEIWKQYTKEQNKAIEKAYRQGESGITIDDYHLNFEVMVQTRVSDSNSVRPIKRDDPRRQKMYQVLLYESIGKYLSPFIVNWQAEFLLEYGAPILKNTQVLIDLIVLGILEEGKIQKQENVSQAQAGWLQKQAKKCNYDTEEIFKCLARLYTEETFLYKTVNRALRENDHRKADTLGAFCLLFNELITYFDTIKKYPYNGTVWRGLQLMSRS